MDSIVSQSALIRQTMGMATRDMGDLLEESEWSGFPFSSCSLMPFISLRFFLPFFLPFFLLG